MARTRRQRGGANTSGPSGSMGMPERLRLTIRAKAKNLLKDMVALYNQQKQRLGKMQAAVNILSREGCNPENMDHVDNYVAKHLDDFNEDITTYKDDASTKVSDLKNWITKFKEFCNNEDPSIDENGLNTEGISYKAVTLAAVRAPPTSNSGAFNLKYPSAPMESGSSESYEGYQESGSGVDVAPGNVAPGNVAPGNVAPGNVAPGNVAPGNVAPGNVAPGNVAPGNVAPGNVAPGNVAPGNVAPGNVAPGNVAPGNVAPGNVAPGNVAPGNVAPGNVAPGNVAPSENATFGNITFENTTKEGGRRKRRHSSRKQKKRGRKTRRR